MSPAALSRVCAESKTLRLKKVKSRKHKCWRHVPGSFSAVQFFLQDKSLATGNTLVTSHLPGGGPSRDASMDATHMRRTAVVGTVLPTSLHRPSPLAPLRAQQVGADNIQSPILQPLGVGSLVVESAKWRVGPPTSTAIRCYMSPLLSSCFHCWLSCEPVNGISKLTC